MKEYDLRKWHRRVGIVLALFIILQAGSGLLISLGGMVAIEESHAHSEQPAVQPTEREGHEHEEGESVWNRTFAFIHHHTGVWWDLYRVLLGAGIVWMTVTGSMIFFRIRARS